MRICFLAPADSAHTEKWCKYFSSKGHDVHVISFTDGNIPGIKLHKIKNKVSAKGGDIQKILYLTCAGQVKKFVSLIKPDIINVHYATSYGTVAALAGLDNYVLSVWGADIYDFPKKSYLHKQLLKYSLKHADHLFSTSKAMAVEASKYTNKKFEITPFGVDTELFSPVKRNRFSGDNNLIIGTVKALTPKYGIDYLIRACAFLREKKPEIPIRIRISGTGSHENEYRKMADELGLHDITEWVGQIPQVRAAEEWASMDIAIIASTLESESFGVSAVEAQASQCPVIISDIPGLMEATKPGVSSIVVPRCSYKELAEAIIKLYEEPELRKKMGEAGRKYVLENYEYNLCFEKIEELFISYTK